MTIRQLAGLDGRALRDKLRELFVRYGSATWAGTKGGRMTDVARKDAPPAVMAEYRAAVGRLRQAYNAMPPGTPVRLAKRTSNLFRFRDPAAGRGAERPGLDVSAFGHVLSVDPAARVAVVGGMTTYEDLCDATLRYGIMPFVVPQLKTITLGGAVSGLGIESTSLRNGMPHESVLEMDILTGDGRVVTAAPRQRAQRPVAPASPIPTGRSATRCRSPSSWSRSARSSTCATSRSTRPGRLHGGRRADRRRGKLRRSPRGLRRRGRVQPR
jgi:hypothetical protein